MQNRNCLNDIFAEKQNQESKDVLNKSNKETTEESNNKSNKDSDKLYTKIYENEKGRQGLDICLGNCKGHCLEYGITGKAFCFEDDDTE